MKLQAANVFLMAQKPVPGGNEQALYLTAAVPTNPGPTQLLLEVSYLLVFARITVTYFTTYFTS